MSIYNDADFNGRNTIQPSKKTKVAIIGAGMGGLSAAVALSKYCDVTVFEQAASPGGKIAQAQINGAFIDCGPTVFTMRWVFDELFRNAGARLDDNVALSPLSTIARHCWPGGAVLDLHRDVERSIEAIAAFSDRREAERFRQFIQRSKAIYNTLRTPFLLRDRPNIAALIMRSNPFALFAIQPFTTLWQSLSKQFRDPRLRQLFARYATYCGSSPFQSPATLMLIAHVEQAGVWTIDGGMIALVRALERVAEKNGVAFRYAAPVAEIICKQSKATGIVLADGERIDADAVVFNGDIAALSNGLLGEAVEKATPSASARRQRSQSAMTWSMMAKAHGVDLSVHNVFFSDDYRREFDDVFDAHTPPEKPTTYIFAPDRTGDLKRTDDSERLFCLINSPANGDGYLYTEQEIERCHHDMSEHLRTCGLTLTTTPQATIATSPSDFANRFAATQGALYGMATHGWRASFQRSGVRSKIRGLYLAGGSVHPGPGVPMTALSGQAAAAAILRAQDLT